MNIGFKAQNAKAVRDYVVDTLRRELVGPSPGYPLVQITREEILRPQDPVMDAQRIGRSRMTLSGRPHRSAPCV
jgi:hypothetical protein